LQRAIIIVRWRSITAAICGVTAALFLSTIMLLTVSDVVLRGVFNLPIRGVYELIELLLAWTFFIALPAVYLRNDHILVNVVDGIAPRAVPYLSRAADFLAVAVLAVMAWQGWKSARDSFEFGDVTGDLALPQTLHWTALLIGVSCTSLAALAVGIFGHERK
jgi:TRAP-type transport system small permease protein